MTAGSDPTQTRPLRSGPVRVAATLVLRDDRLGTEVVDTTASDFRTLASDIDRYIPPSSRIDEGYSSPTPNTAPRGSQPAGSRMWKRYLTDHLTEIAAHTDSNRERWVIAVYLYLGVCRKSGIVPFRTGGTPPPLSVVDPQQHTALHRLEVQVGKLLTMCNRMETTLRHHCAHWTCGPFLKTHASLSGPSTCGLACPPRLLAALMLA